MRQAGCMLIVKDGLILGVSRKNDITKFGLPGSKVDGNETQEEAAIRETLEETGIKVNKCERFFNRTELPSYPGGEEFESATFYALDWEGEISSTEEGDVKWLIAKELTSSSAAFPDYNSRMLNVFKQIFTKVYIKGEW